MSIQDCICFGFCAQVLSFPQKEGEKGKKTLHRIDKIFLYRSLDASQSWISPCPDKAHPMRLKNLRYRISLARPLEKREKKKMALLTEVLICRSTNPYAIIRSSFVEWLKVGNTSKMVLLQRFDLKKEVF